MKQLPQPIEVDPARIRPFISRKREAEGYEQMKASIHETGQKYPVGLRDIRHLPESERKRPEGGCYFYEHIFGEGRIEACRDLGIKVWAVIGDDIKEADVISMFLAENFVRQPLSWHDKAQLIKADLDAGMKDDDLASKYFISPKHARKYAHIVSKTAGAEEEVKKMSVNDAEVFATLPPDDQAIVISVLKETSERDIQAVVKKARQVKKDTGELSVSGLKKSIDRVTDDIKELRDKLKLTRLHHSLGSQNLELLLQDKSFRKAAEKAGVPFKKFEALISR